MGQKAGKYNTGTPERECKLLFDSFDAEKTGKLDAKRSQKFLTKMYKANLFRAQELSLKHYLAQMMENFDLDKDGSLSWDDLQAFHGQGAFSDDDKSSKPMSYLEEGSEFIWLWNYFGCPMPIVVPTSVPPSSFASSFFRTSSSCFRYGPSLLPFDSSLPRSSSATVIKPRTSSNSLPFCLSPLPSDPDSVYKLLQYLFHQEPRYGFIPEDARSMMSAFEKANVPLNLSTFLGKDPSAVDVMTTWKAEDGLRQRMLKMQDSELLKLIKLTAGTCERPLLYALNEDIRPALDPFFPYVLQTEIMQYLLERDSARLTLKQEIAQLLYLIAWRTEEPGLTQAQYSRLIATLETFVEAARQIKPDSYSRRTAETNVYTGLQVCAFHARVLTLLRFSPRHPLPMRRKWRGCRRAC